MLRAAALTKGVDAGGYGAIMAGDYPRRADDGAVGFTADIGEAARHYKEGFDHSDDPLIRGIRDGLGGIVDGVGRAAASAADSVGHKFSGWRRSASDDD